MKKSIFNKLRKKLRLLYKPDSYLYLTGYLRTLETGRPETPEGEPLPWMPYPIIPFLKKRLNKDMLLFEYGSGYSTLFYSTLVKKVYSVEANHEWYFLLKKKIKDNVHLIYCSAKDKFPSIINTINTKFDVIVVDGPERLECVKNSLSNLSYNGVIILDDTHSLKNQEGVLLLLKEGFSKLDFEGLKPNGFGIDKTSVFYKKENCLDI